MSEPTNFKTHEYKKMRLTVAPEDVLIYNDLLADGWKVEADNEWQAFVRCISPSNKTFILTFERPKANV